MSIEQFGNEFQSPLFVFAYAVSLRMNLLLYFFEQRKINNCDFIEIRVNSRGSMVDIQFSLPKNTVY
jgi:hypothetical protein